MLSWQALRQSSKTEQALKCFSATQGSGGSLYTLRLSRSPNFFEALTVEGTYFDVLGVIHEDTIKALAIRSEKQLYVNTDKQPRTIGYLGSLYIEKSRRGSMLLQRGYRFLKQLHQQSSAEAYLTTILSNNKIAQKILTSGRGALPEYYPVGRYLTHAILPKSSRITKTTSYDIRQGNRTLLAAIEGYLKQCGEERNFFPAYTSEDLMGHRLLKGFDLSNLYLAFYQGRIVASLGIWNQQAFRQWHLDSPLLKSKILCNLLNLTRSFHGLPHYEGEIHPLSFMIAALPMALSGHETAFVSLLETAIHDLYEREPGSSLMIGLHEDDPLNKAVKKRALLKFCSQMYLVSWQDEPRIVPSKKLVPYLELGAL